MLKIECLRLVSFERITLYLRVYWRVCTRAVFQLEFLLTSFTNLIQKSFSRTQISDSLNSIDDQRDFFVFTVTDGYNPFIDRKFFIHINAGDKLYPMVFNEGLTLPEDGRRTLTTQLLQASDLNSNDLDLVFNVIRLPVKGHIESTDAQGTGTITISIVYAA